MGKEVKCQVVGRGTPSCAHDSVIFQPDFEGVQTPFQMNEPVFRGGRSNRIAPNFWENDTETNDNPSIQLTDPFDLDTDIIDGSLRFKIIGIPNGATSIFILRLRLAPSQAPWHSFLFFVNNHTLLPYLRLTEQDATSTKEVQWIESVELGKEYFVEFFANGTQFGFSIDGGDPVLGNYNGTIHTGDRWDVSQPTNGQALWGHIWDLTLEGRFMPFDEGQGTDIHDSEGNVVGLVNVNTNDLENFWKGRVRIEGGATFNDDYEGNILPDPPALHYQNDALNQIIDSFNLVNWNTAGSGEVLLNQIGLTGESNKATFVNDNNTSEIFAVIQQSLAVSETINYVTFVYKIKKVETATANIRLENGTLSDADSDYKYISFNPETGVVSFSSADLDYKVIDNGYYFTIILFKNITDSGTNRVRGYVAPAIYNIDSNSSDVSLTGSVIVLYVGAFFNTTMEEVENLGPIFTSGAAASTDRTIYQYEGLNFNNSAMALYCEVEPIDGFLIGDFFNFDIADFYLVDDQANAVNMPATMEQINRIGIVVSVDTMAINVEGSWSADGTYSGSLQDFANMVELFQANEYPGAIRKIMVYHGGVYADLKAKIDELMV